MGDIYSAKREAMKVASLRLLPVLTTTASTMFAVSEVWTLLPFLQPSIEDKSVSTWFKGFFNYSLPGVIGLGLTSTIGGYLGWKNTAGGARLFYGWGTILAAGHFIFVPTIAPVIKRIVDGPSNPKDDLMTWLKIHAIRTFTTDIPAFVCFLGAFLHL